MAGQYPPLFDNSTSSAGLHNLVTGLTSQSPALSPAAETNITSSSLPKSSRAPSRQPLFNTPSRSVLSSGAPTSSVSVNTAHTSMTASASSSSSHPLSTLTLPSPGSGRRTVTGQQLRSGASERTRPCHTAEKEVDDPNLPTDGSSLSAHHGTLTPVELTRLFAATSIAPASRRPSFSRALSSTYPKICNEMASPLPHHLWTRGFLDGRHSDITVHAFSTSYSLHRILLDRAPFFSSALSEPWFESTAKEISLHPEEIDPNITQSSFELALKHLYGSSVSVEEGNEAVGLFATGSWLEMADLVQSSLDHLLRTMSTANVAELIKLVTSNYYGPQGERLLAAAKAMLYREGWEMNARLWDDIAADMIRDIVGGDGFFVPGEWDRWRLSKKLFERRLQNSAIAYGMLIETSKRKTSSTIVETTRQVKSSARVSPPARQSPPAATNEAAQWQILYAHPDVTPLLDLLEEGIHYVHLTFEQLERIRMEKDMFGRPLVPEETLTNALWMSMELRRKVLNARDTQSELGLKHAMPQARETFLAHTEAGEEMVRSNSSNSGSSEDSKHHGKTVENESGSWARDENGHRRFWIPSVDSTKVVGDNSDVFSGRFATTSSTRRSSLNLPMPQQARSAANESQGRVSVQSPEHVERSSSPHVDDGDGDSFPQYYTTYPPYRFSVEFPNPRLLKDKKRVYSRTVEYLGSHWNIYIQKIRSSKNVQLGVYLHRAKDRESEDRLRGVTGPRSVDEAIGQLEREMLLRRTERRLRRQQQYEAQLEGEESSSDSENVLRTTGVSASASRDGLLSTAKASQTPKLTLSNIPDHAYAAARDGASEEDDDSGPPTTGGSPALPRYVDGRPTITTYFKVYSPTKAGLSVYESAPDGFNFSQSWGWRSSMILDGNAVDGDGTRSRDGRLRFSVVLGNV